MARDIGYDSTEENVSEGGTLSSPITIDAERADVAYVYVDDGTGSAVTEAYSLTIEVEKTLPHDSGTDSAWFDIEAGISGSTAKFNEIASLPSSNRARVDLTNDADAGGAQDYRVIFETQSQGAN